MSLGDLKPGWRRVKFGEVVRLSKERSADPAADGLDRYVGLEHLEPGDLRIRSWGNVADGTTFTTRFRPGQVLFGKRRAYQRKVAVADFEGVCSGDIYVFESANPKHLLPELLPFICQTDAFFDHAVGTSAGSLSPRTNWTSLADYEFALPPLGEQGRMAVSLSAANEAIESLQHAKEKCNNILTTVRNSLLTNGIVNGLYSETQYLGRVPSHWPICTLEDISFGEYGIVDGPFGSNLKRIHFRTNGHPVIKSSMVVSDCFCAGADSYDYVDDMKFKELRRNHVYPGDVVIALIGVNCGACAILPDTHPPSIISQNCLKISPNPSICRRSFLAHYIRWLRESGRLLRQISFTAQPALSLGRLRSQKIALPPVNEQVLIEGHLASIEAAASMLVLRTERARSLMKGLLLTRLEADSNQ